MKRKIEFKNYYACDFETSNVYDYNYVWSFACCELHNHANTRIYPSIFDFFDFIEKLENNTVLYFHNLKFDGTFIIAHMLENSNRYTALTTATKNEFVTEDSNKGDFSYLITSKGQWYRIQIKTKNAIIEIRDSLKLLPFSLAKLTTDFKVKHQKTTMEYDKTSLEECNKADIQYILNDVIGLAECLEIFEEQYTLSSLTIGSACLSWYKKECRNCFGKSFYNNIIYQHEKDIFDKYEKILFKADNAEQYGRKFYTGAFCYVANRAKNRIVKRGVVLDVNSLYPDRMKNCKYPIGKGIRFFGKIEDKDIDLTELIVFRQIKIGGVKLKKGKLPTFQIKNDLRFKPNEWVKKIEYDERVVLHLTDLDYELLMTHYDIQFIEYLGGIYFRSTDNTEKIFSFYVEHFMKIKENSSGAKRQISKLFLNNLYGKFAMSRKCDYKILQYTSEGVLKYQTIEADELRDSVNIYIGAMITAYARYKTITTAQQNYKYFCYADTDSLHCECSINDLVNVEIHPTKLGAWAVEGEFYIAKFLRQKTYCEIEQYVFNDDLANFTRAVHITACGMNENCKNEVVKMIDEKGVNIFETGLEIVNGKLTPELTRTGTILTEHTFKIR